MTHMNNREKTRGDGFNEGEHGSIMGFFPNMVFLNKSNRGPGNIIDSRETQTSLK